MGLIWIPIFFRGGRSRSFPFQSGSENLIQRKLTKTTFYSLPIDLILRGRELGNSLYRVSFFMFDAAMQIPRWYWDSTNHRHDNS